MASAVLLYRVTFPKLVGSLGDAPSNDFVFSENPAVPFAASDALIAPFYNSVGSGGTNPICFYLAESLDRSIDAVQVNVYDITSHLDGTPAGPPVHMFNFTLGAAQAGKEPLPESVSFVVNHDAGLGNLSEFGPIVSTIPTDERAQDEGAPPTHSGRTRPRSRRRGRMFLPPLLANVLDRDNTSLESVPSVQFGIDVAGAAKALHTTALSAGIDWAVWSRRNADVQATLSGWLRDSFATSRRRGREDAPKVNWLP